MVQAITNIQIGLNVFTGELPVSMNAPKCLTVFAEYIVGYMLPGRPLAMMSFKTYGYIAMYQGVVYSQDLKLGKIAYVELCSLLNKIRSLHEGSPSNIVLGPSNSFTLELSRTSCCPLLGVWKYRW
jgi:hypothetical protein